MTARPAMRPLAVVLGFGASLLTAGCVPPPPSGSLPYDYGVEFGAPPLPLVAPPLLGPPLPGPGPGLGPRPMGSRPLPGGRSSGARRPWSAADAAVAPWWWRWIPRRSAAQWRRVPWRPAARWGWGSRRRTAALTGNGTRRSGGSFGGSFRGGGLRTGGWWLLGQRRQMRRAGSAGPRDCPGQCAREGQRRTPMRPFTPSPEGKVKT
jgi:hypothetical protein